MDFENGVFRFGAGVAESSAEPDPVKSRRILQECLKLTEDDPNLVHGSPKNTGGI